MRLDDFDPNIDVEDQRGSGGFGGGGGGGIGGGLLFAFLPFIFNRFGCVGVLVVGVLFLLFSGSLSMVGSDPQGGTGRPPAERRAGTDVTSSCNLDASSKEACNAFSSANKTWAALFAKEGARFAAPKLVFYSGNGRTSGCGAAQSAMGPFYCPGDNGIYLDTSFFQELSQRFGAQGDFARDYVIAHEFGHHIQSLTGVSRKVNSIQQRSSETEGNRYSVMLELQADCYAGVWAAMNRDRLDPGDVEEGMTAARAIGDDTLQREAQGRVVPDSFTHGSSADRMKWLKIGMDTGDPARCDTFQGAL